MMISIFALLDVHTYLLEDRASSAQYVYEVKEYHKNYFQHLTTIFMSTWWWDCKNMQDIERPTWLFQPIQPIRQHFFPCLCLPSESHRENQVSCTFLHSLHQVNMKNVGNTLGGITPLHKHIVSESLSLSLFLSHSALFPKT